MNSNRTTGEKVFNITNYAILSVLMVICIYPLWHILMASISDPIIVFGKRGFFLWPVGKVALKGYKLVFENPNILTGFMNSFFMWWQEQP
jgi:putative aldouronate transport system permease protein